MIRQVSWNECFKAAHALWLRQRGNPNITGIYGVPRGGVAAALLVHSIAIGDLGHILTLQERPGDPHRTLIVDDLVDSGRTLQGYHERGYSVDVLFRKEHSPSHLAPCAEIATGWLTFPYEQNEREETGAEDAIVRLLQFLGEDPNREGLQDTPARVLRAWSDMTAGYRQDPDVILSARFNQPHDELVMLRGIEFYSTCEHHLLPFYGTAAIGYIPTEQVVGISKLARLVECFGRRLQIQERMTTQIAEAIAQILKPKGVGVVIKAKHACIGCRGIMKPDCDMVTSVTLGALREDSRARAEFLSLVSI